MAMIYGLYNDDHRILEAVKTLHDQGLHIREVYSPFPVHGMDKALGMKPTRMGIVSFLCGITGTVLALFGLWYFMIHDWPLNIGGKPNFELYTNLPSFIPVVFEFTVLCAGHLMVIIMMLRNWTLPGVSPRNPDPRTTDDHFAMEIDPKENERSEDDIYQLLRDTGAIETFAK